MSQTHHHSAPQDSYYIPDAIWDRGRNVIGAFFLLAWAAALAGYASNHDQFFQSYLVAFFFGFTIAIGGALFVMIQHLTGSAWSVPVRRIMENIMMSLPVLGLLFIPLGFGVHALYEWSHPEFVAKEIMALKVPVYEAFLNPKMFYIRAVIYFAIWTLWSWRLYSNSKAQDTTKSLLPTFSNERWSAPGNVGVLPVGLPGERRLGYVVEPPLVLDHVWRLLPGRRRLGLLRAPDLYLSALPVQWDHGQLRDHRALP